MFQFVILITLEEKNMKKRILSMLLAMTLMLSFTACTTDSNDGIDSSTTENQNGEKIKLIAPVIAYNDDQIAAANKKAEEDGLEISATTKYYMGVRETIKEEHPEYEVEYVDWGWAETLDQKQRSLIAAGSPSDIVSGEIFIPIYANEGILEPLPQDIVDSVDPAFLIYDPDGKAVAVAHKASVFMLFYNKDLMTKAGLDPETPPTTWEEFKEMSDTITAAGNGDFYGGGIPTFPHAGGSLRATPFFRQNGTDFSIDGQSNLEDPALIETLEFIREMNNNYPPALGNNSDEGPMWNAFEKDQNLAFVINGSWQAFGAERNGVNWGVAPLPIPEGGTDGNCLVGAVYNAVPKAAKNKEASFNLIRAALKEENQKLWLDEVVAVPLKSIIDDPSNYEDNATLATAFEVVKSGGVKGLATFDKNDAQVWEIINSKVLARTTMTNDPIEQIVKDANKEITPLLK